MGVNARNLQSHPEEESLRALVERNFPELKAFYADNLSAGEFRDRPPTKKFKEQITLFQARAAAALLDSVRLNDAGIATISPENPPSDGIMIALNQLIAARVLSHDRKMAETFMKQGGVKVTEGDSQTPQTITFGPGLLVRMHSDPSQSYSF